MRRLLYPCLIVSVTFALGCEASKPYPRSQGDATLFGPAAMRIHPIFTQVKDWTNDGKPDGIEALLELQDQFGDPTKASGSVVFELFEYRAYDPEIRGQRVANPWIGDLSSMDAQRERWNRTSRTYGFQLAYPQVNENQAYVLTATFELSNGGRYFDRMILEAKEPRVVEPARTEPTTQPGQ
jgi:hypothetical protein